MKPKRHKGRLLVWIVTILALSFTAFSIHEMFVVPIQSLVCVPIMIAFFCWTVLIFPKDDGIISREFFDYEEFVLYEFDYWNEESSSYIKGYDVRIRKKYAKFFLTWFIKYQIDKIRTADIIMKQKNEWNEKPDFKTIEDAMRSILKIVTDRLKEKATENNVLIRSGSIVKKYTMEELELMVMKEESK